MAARPRPARVTYARHWAGLRPAPRRTVRWRALRSSARPQYQSVTHMMQEATHLVGLIVRQCGLTARQACPWASMLQGGVLPVSVITRADPQRFARVRATANAEVVHADGCLFVVDRSPGAAALAICGGARSHGPLILVGNGFSTQTTTPDQRRIGLNRGVTRNSDHVLAPAVLP